MPLVGFAESTIDFLCSEIIATRRSAIRLPLECAQPARESGRET